MFVESYQITSEFLEAESGGTYFFMVGALQDIRNLTMKMKLINNQQEQEKFWRIPKILLLLLVVYQFHFYDWIPNVLHGFNHEKIGAPDAASQSLIQNNYNSQIK